MHSWEKRKVTKSLKFRENCKYDGLNGIQEVVSSILIGSTFLFKDLANLWSAGCVSIVRFLSVFGANWPS